MIKKNAKIKVQFLYWLIAFSFLARLVAAYFTGDINDLQSASVNEWNILIRNFIKYKTYSFYTHLGEAIPSVYMPPFYPFLLYLIKGSTSFLGRTIHFHPSGAHGKPWRPISDTGTLPKLQLCNVQTVRAS